MTPEQTALAKHLRDNESIELDLIAERLGVRTDTVRRALIPEYRDRRNKAAKAWRERQSIQKAMGVAGTSNGATSDARNPLYDPFRDGPPVYRSVGDWITGNPPIGRSALDMRGRDVR